MAEELKETKKPLVLIADDDPEILSYLEICLKEKKCDVVSAEDGEMALKELKKHKFDLIILDVKMPNKNGIEVCQVIKSDENTKHIPVIMLTSSDDWRIMMECYEAGADEFLRKPVSPLEIFARIKAMLRIKSLYDSLLEINNDLKKDINKKTEEWNSIYAKTVKLLADMVAPKDVYSGHRAKLVTEYSVEIAKEMGLNEYDIEKIKRVAELNDLSKIAISDTIPDKKGKLTEEEYEEIKEHSDASVKILESFSTANELKQYPMAGKGGEIPMGARIIVVADAYVSMTSDRADKKALSEQEAIKELEKNIGTKFDPDVIKALIGALQKKAR